MNTATVRDRATDLPAEPGVYQFLDGERVLYVGKAVALPDRVRSYADPRSERIRQMVARADDLDVAVTDTESQALLLEANLIKRHRPRYNVRLKDDKSYPVVALTDHEVPQIKVTRDPGAGATVFGPFTEMRALETVVKALRRVYGLRGCSDHKYTGRDRPCLDYEMGLCSAPCTGEISTAAYQEAVTAVERFFEGETGMLTDPLQTQMEAAAADKQFERAANLRDALTAVERLRTPVTLLFTRLLTAAGSTRSGSRWPVPAPRSRCYARRMVSSSTATATHWPRPKGPTRRRRWVRLFRSTMPTASSQT